MAIPRPGKSAGRIVFRPIRAQGHNRAMPSPASPAVTARWDLTALFSGLNDPKIAATWEEAMARADAFAEKYRGKIETSELDADTLLRGLQELEEIVNEAGKPAHYAELVFSADTSKTEHGAFLQMQMERHTELSVKLMFFDLELMGAPEEAVERALATGKLENYRHHIQRARAFSPHRLTEPEEIILEETANTGVRAWVRLFDEVTSNHVFRLRDPDSGETEELSQQEVLDRLRSPSRAVRQAAADSLTAGLQELERVLVFTFNNILQDKRVGDRLRSHPYPEHSRHLANELDRKTVDLVVRLCRENYGLVERFYRVKRQILGLDKLTHIDRYAPLHEAEQTVSYDEARKLVLDAFGEFSSEVSQRAEEFFEKNWIDAEPRPGKTGGAFCASITPDTHPAILMTYLNKLDNVETLAHELGHGVHASLARAQTPFNFHSTLPLAELASTFGEMLVFEKLVASANPRDRLALYAEKIEGAFATVFRQAAMFQFEQECHRLRREEGELPPDRIGEVWQEKLQEMFGDSVELGEQHRSWWSYVGHFVFAPFYVYAYAFGELLALSLFQRSKQEGPAFERKYVELLRLGGSRSPQELMATVGVDLDAEEFWQGGFGALEGLVEEFERLWSEIGSA
jgi:oligoendopeptidase F